MHALIVVSHPLQHSLTHGSAAAIAQASPRPIRRTPLTSPT